MAFISYLWSRLRGTRTDAADADDADGLVLELAACSKALVTWKLPGYELWGLRMWWYGP